MWDSWSAYKSSSRNFSEMNDTLLEIGGSNWGMVEQGKILAAGIWMMLTTAFIVPTLISAWLTIASPPEFNRHFFDIVGGFIEVFALGSLYGIIPLGAYLYGIFSDVLFSPKSYPVRFNRQRREVCYVDDKTHRVLIVPWESVVAWVSNTQGITSYGATRQYTFGIGLEDEELDKVQFLLLSQPSDAHALGMWTSIRNFMEDGQLVDVPNPMLQALGLIPTEDRLKPYEGLHTFEIELDDARAMCRMEDDGANLSDKERAHSGFPKRTPWPLRFWYIRRVLCFWKMPYLFRVERMEAGNTSTSSTTSITAVTSTNTPRTMSPIKISRMLPVFSSRNIG
jgi:hypothetical protein